MSYLDKKGSYYMGNKQPGSVDAQERPTVDSVLIDDPLSDPLNCWRDKTAAEVSAEIDAEEATMGFSDFRLVMAKALHNINNRVRAMESKAPWTLKQTIKALRKL